MRNILLIIAVCFVAQCAWSAPRTQAQMLEIVSSHFSHSKQRVKSSVSFEQAIPASQLLANAKSTTTSTEEPFYVFTIDSTAFVIVSTEDRMSPILGYSDKRSFSRTQIAANVRNWLQQYYDEYLYLQNQPEGNGNGLFYYRPTASALPTTVGPLLGQIAWDQSTPYNGRCPLYKAEGTVTGCVATAMAQIMMYHRYPDAGVGSHSYTTEALGLSLSADFSQPIDWHNMTPTYDQYSTVESRQAVAKLMYQCGVAVNMDYNISSKGGSSAKSADVPQALATYFKYSPHYHSYSRDYYRYDQWIDMVKRELSAHRPILYRGQSSGGGHSFVLDGYDSKDMIHVNWGWSGQANGYFVISSLSPKTLGIGGGLGGYNAQQTMFQGIQRPSSDTHYESSFITYDPVAISASSIARTGLFSMATTRLYNQGSDFSGKLQAVLYKNGEPVVAFGRALTTKLGKGYGYTKKLEFANLSIPSTVQPGDYQLHLASKDARESQWSVVRSKIHHIGYYNVHVEADRVTFSSPIDPVNIELSSLELPHQLYTSMRGDFLCEVANLGTECIAFISLFARPIAGGDYKLLDKEIAFLAQGGRSQIAYRPTITLSPGIYNILVAYSLDGSAWTPMKATPKQVTVNQKPTGLPVLRVSSPIEVAQSILSVGEPLRVKSTISNSGAPFSSYISFSFYDTATLPKSYVSRVKASIFIDSNDQAIWSLDQNPQLKVGVYEMQLRYLGANNGYFAIPPLENSTSILTVVEGVSGVGANPTKGLDLYYCVSDSRLYMTFPEAVDRVDIINLSGVVVWRSNLAVETGNRSSISVEKLPSALYMVKAYTNKRVYIAKFIKQ